MNSTTEFTAPAAKIEKPSRGALPCPFTANGMLQPSHLQPPPMFGPRGTTIPPKFLPSYKPKRMEPPPPIQFKANPTNFQPRFSNSHQQRTQQHHHHQNYNKKPNHYQNNQSFRFNHQSQTRNHNFRDKNHNQKLNLVHGSTNNEAGTKEFWCEPCDRDFSTINELNEHRNQHKKCTIDGCKFEGHEKLVTNHIQMQHTSGLYDKIRKLNTPEEIAAWREERRKKYPMKKNIELRQKMQDQRIKRGEKLEDSKKRFGRKEDCRRGVKKNDDQQKNNTQKSQQKKRRRKRNRTGDGNEAGGDDNKSGIENKSNNDGDDEDEDSDHPKKFAGTSGIIDYERPSTITTQNSLSGLIGMYDSSENDMSNSDNEVEPINNAPIIKLTSNKSEECITINKLEDKPPSPMEEIVEVSVDQEEIDAEIQRDEELLDNDEDPPDEQIVERHHTEIFLEEPPQAATTSENKNSPKILEPPTKKMKKSEATIFDLSKKYRNQNTMLEKLLQKDIRHERNVLLQCVRYVVENKFFGIGSDEKKPLN